MADPTGAKPLGVVTRHPADWFSDEFYTGAWLEEDAIVGPGEMFIAIGMFNGDSNGRVLRIYGGTAFAEGGGGMGIYFVHGTIGSQVANAKSVRPDRPTPSVSMWSEHQQVALGGLSPFNFGDPFGIMAAPGFDSGTVVSQFPMFIVPVGWSIVASMFQSSQVGGMHWWFQLANL
jgi:hypothetical protein